MNSYFPDVNVWLALTYRGHRNHVAATSWFDALKNDTAGFCRSTQIGLLRLLAHPTVMGQEVKSPLEAWEVYDLISNDPHVMFYSELDSNAVEDEFRRLTTTARFAHQQWPDAYLAAFARVAGLILVTFDRGLNKLAGKDVLLLR